MRPQRVASAVYTFGIEEEYFVFDAKTRRAMRRSDKKFLALARAKIGGRAMTELLQSQIEVATPPCAGMSKARGHLARYRREFGDAAAVKEVVDWAAAETRACGKP